MVPSSRSDVLEAGLVMALVVDNRTSEAAELGKELWSCNDSWAEVLERQLLDDMNSPAVQVTELLNDMNVPAAQATELSNSVPGLGMATGHDQSRDVHYSHCS